MPPTPTPSELPSRPPGTKDHRTGEAYNYAPPRQSAFQLHEEGKPAIAVEIDGQLDENDAIVESHTVEVEGTWRKDGALHTRRVVDRDTGAIIAGKRPIGAIVIIAVLLIAFVAAVVFVAGI